MKIAMVIPNLDVAGAQVMVIELLSRLVKTNDEYVLIVMQKKQHNILSEKVKELNIRLRYLTINKRGYISRKIEYYKKLAKVLSEEHPDIIHAHLEYHYTWLYCILNKKIIIETIHSQAYRVKSLLILGEYKLLRKNGLIYPVVFSESGRYEFEQLFHESKENITIIPNPVNYKKYLIPDRAYTSEIINFVFVARFEEIKNHDMLLRAFCIAEKEMPDIRLILVGDGKLLEKEKQTAKQLGVENKILFTGQRSDISRVLKESDVCVISSKSEAFPLALIEAMAAGLPVIVTSVGGMRDIVKDNGVLVKSNDEKAFANAMIDLARNKEKRREMGEKSVQLAQKYDTKICCEKYMELYKKCVKEHS